MGWLFMIFETGLYCYCENTWRDTWKGMSGAYYYENEAWHTKTESPNGKGLMRVVRREAYGEESIYIGGQVKREHGGKGGGILLLQTTFTRTSSFFFLLSSFFKTLYPLFFMLIFFWFFLFSFLLMTCFIGRLHIALDMRGRRRKTNR